MNDTAKCFRVAFSFAGEKREFVARVAAILAERFSKEAVLYDKYHEAPFARHDLGFYLPNSYQHQSDLVVAVLCRDYHQKKWCGWEWRTIFALFTPDQGSKVMLCRFDQATGPGLSGIEGFVELDDKTPHDAAARILERLASNEGNCLDYYNSGATRPYVRGSSFIGRRTEVAEIENLVVDHSIVTLTGPGGSGKTQLAFEVAERVWPQFADGWCPIDLAPLSRQSAVEDEVARQLVPKEQQARPAVDILAEYFSKKKTLLVLDNCEHLTDACAELVRKIVNQNKNIRIVATSQLKLNVSGEVVFNVNSLEHADAVRLFNERARLHDRYFREENVDTVHRICNRLEGMPLALELAAAWVMTLSVEQIAEMLEDSLRFVTLGSKDAPARQQTLTATIEWSFGLLTDDQKSLLSRLSVFRGGWNLQAMSQVFESESSDKVTMAVWLSKLVEKSIVQVKPLPFKTYAHGKRYQMLETIRQFAAAKLIKAEEETLRKRHRDWCLKFAEERAPVLREGGDQDRVLEEIEMEHDNLLGALYWCTAKSDWESALRLCANLWRFWEICRLSEGRKHLRQLIDTVEKIGLRFDTAETAETVAALGRVYSGAGLLAYRQGDSKDAMILFERAFEIEEKRNDAKRIANCLNDLGLAAYARGNLKEALQYYTDYLKMARKIDAKREIAIGLFNVGHTELRLGHFEDARSPLEESRKGFEELHHSDIAYPMTALGWLAVFDNDSATAQSFFEASLKSREQFKNKRGMVDCWNGLGRAAILHDDFEEGRRCLTEGLTKAREVGADKAILQIIESFAILAACENEMVKALTLSAAAKASREKIQSPRTPAFAKDQEKWMEKAKGALAADKSDDAIADGLAMKLDDIINLACPNPSLL